MEQNRLTILHGGTIASMVDLGGSLAVASRGLFATGVSTDLNGIFPPSPILMNRRTDSSVSAIVTYLNSGGKVGDTIRAEATCDKCKVEPMKHITLTLGAITDTKYSWQDARIYIHPIHEL